MKIEKSHGDELVTIETPDDCREFIKNTVIQGRKIEFLQQSDGKQISIDDASDDQVIQVATEIARALNASCQH